MVVIKDSEYFKHIRSLRKTKPEGYFQKLDPEARKELAKRAASARWNKNKENK